MRRWPLVVVLALVLGLVGCDHATKGLAAARLAEGPAVVIPGVLELVYAENRDSAFSLLHPAVAETNRRCLLLVAALLGSAAGLGVLARRWHASGWLEKAALATLLGGALGNLLDRALRGFVVDFIHLTRWPVFNVADVALCCGGALLWIAARRTEAARGPSPPGSGRVSGSPR